MFYSDTTCSERATFEFKIRSSLGCEKTAMDLSSRSVEDASKDMIRESTKAADFRWIASSCKESLSVCTDDIRTLKPPRFRAVRSASRFPISSHSKTEFVLDKIIWKTSEI